MKRILYNKYPKQDIATLPVAQFQGRIVVILSAGETNKAVDYLLRQPRLGFDTETRPSFRPGENHPVALLQVSTPDICFLFRLNRTGLTPAILRLLENTDVPLIGLSCHDDILSLSRRKAFKPGNIVDLQHMVGALGIEDLSLQKLYANFFGEKISKRQQLTNWEADVLTEKQKTYAAIDAWACLRLYNEILRLQKSRDYEYVVLKEDEPAADT